MGSETFLRLEKFDNGYTVEIKDPAIVKYNNKRDSENSTKGAVYQPYKDPWKSFVFKTDAEVLAFLTKNLKKAVASAKADDFDSSFNIACDSD